MASAISSRSLGSIEARLRFRVEFAPLLFAASLLATSLRVLLKETISAE